MNISATILAAGSSKRMEGANKLLLLYKGQTLINLISLNLINSFLDPIFIITGFEHKKILKNLPKSLNNIIYNKDWSMGISKSINIAISSLPDHIDGNMFILGDMPLITIKTLNKLKSAFKMSDGEKIIYADDKKQPLRSKIPDIKYTEIQKNKKLSPSELAILTMNN